MGYKHGAVVAGVKVLIGAMVVRTLDDSIEGELIDQINYVAEIRRGVPRFIFLHCSPRKLCCRPACRTNSLTRVVVRQQVDPDSFAIMPAD